MKCEVCDKQIENEEFGIYYLDHYYKIYELEYNYFDKSSPILNEKFKYDVLVCSECCIENNEQIPIPYYIPKPLFKKYLIAYIKKTRRI